MNKEQLLQELSNKINSGEISYVEVMNRFNKNPMNESPQFSITKMLYVLGAIIVVVGLVLFTSQIWNDIGSLGRISVTLGLGLLITAIGSMLYRNKEHETVGTVFHFIGGLMIPGGVLVALSEFNLYQTTWPTAMSFGLIFVFYLVINFIHKNPILTFFTIANGTAFVYMIVSAMVSDLSINNYTNLYAYLTMIVGICYLLLAHSFREGWNSRLTEVLNFIGSAGLFFSAFSRIYGSLPWQLFFIILVIGGFMMSVYIRSRSILVVSTLSILAYVSYITSQYFADSIGWPISLVILGFLFIGLGYMSIRINSKYIRQ